MTEQPRTTPRSVDLFEPMAPAPNSLADMTEGSPEPLPHLVPGGVASLASRFRAEHTGLLLTLGYLAIASCGMLFEAMVFLHFRINIMDFAEPSDFLLAALRDPLILVAGLLAVPFVTLYFRYVVRPGAAVPARRRWWHGTDRGRAFVRRWYYPLFASMTVVYAVAFTGYYALHVARNLRAGIGPHVHVELVADPGHMQADTSALVLLGSTQKYLFLFDPARQVTSIVPTGNVARVLVDRRKAAQGR